MKKAFIGIDISKESLDFAICDDHMRIIKQAKVSNTLSGIDQLISRIKKIESNETMWVCFEHTGNYGLLLAHRLGLSEIKYCAVPALEIKHSIGLTRGKNDKIDAIRIAMYASTHSHKLKQTELPAQNLLEMKQLLVYREQLVKTSVQFQNSLKAFRICHQVINITNIVKDIERRIEGLRQDIKQLEQQIEALLEMDNELNKNYEKIRQVKGVGLLIAANVVLVTNNFNSITNPRKFNCYAGLAPFEHKSGSSIQGATKTSHLRNKTIKKLLFNGANVAANYDGQLKQYYRRKKEEGKHHQSIINAIACKMIYRIFAVVNRDSPYVNFVH